MPPAGGVLVYRPGALGDCLLLGPSLATLRRVLPNRPVSLVCHPTAAPILHAAGLTDAFLEQDDPRVDTLYSPTSEAPSRAFGVQEAVVAYVSSPPASLRANLAAVSSGRCVVALSQPNLKSTTHVAQHLLDCLAPLGVNGDALAWPGLDLPAAATDRLVIQPGSGSVAKCWPLERFETVGSEIVRQVGLTPTWLLGPAEERLQQRLAASGWELLIEPKPLDLAVLLAGCRLYLGNDSGVTHLAGMLGAPTVALFGPTDPARWRPLGPRVCVVSGRSLAELSTGKVRAAAEALLSNV